MSIDPEGRCPKCLEQVGSKDTRCWNCGFEFRPTVKLTGLSSSYYTLPEGCKELQDLIEYRDMNFARGNCFKAIYRMGDKPGTDQIYDWEKIIWFANREIKRLKKKDTK